MYRDFYELQYWNICTTYPENNGKAKWDAREVCEKQNLLCISIVSYFININETSVSIAS